MPISEVSTTSRPLQPDFAFMRQRLSRWIAFGLGSGLSGTAPGTVGTLAAWAAFVLVAPQIGTATAWAIVAAGFLLGVWACQRTTDDLGVDDHGAIVWDEIIAFWALLLLIPAGYGWQFLAFVMFRFFDIVKPPPIRQIDRRMKSGLGVMLDDLLAAAMAWIVILLIGGLRGG